PPPVATARRRKLHQLSRRFLPSQSLHATAIFLLQCLRLLPGSADRRRDRGQHTPRLFHPCQSSIYAYSSKAPCAAHIVQLLPAVPAAPPPEVLRRWDNRLPEFPRCID